MPWRRFHSLIVVALGVTWILDGLEVTLAGSLGAALMASPSLHLSPGEIGAAASAYLAGNIIGAVFFGWLADRWGRRRLFSITLGLYLIATAATACAWSFGSFALFRALTGAGIGGEGAAIASAIQEFMPPRFRGRVDITLNGSFWIGAALGAGVTIPLLDPALLPEDWGWRAAFGLGALLGLIILFLRRYVPESPRWLLTHGRREEAARIVAAIEAGARPTGEPARASPPEQRLPQRIGATGMAAALHSLLVTYRRRTLLVLSLITAQAFFYNAIFFTYALILSRFYGVPAAAIGWYILPFALGNFAGPLLLGPLFDTIGRKPMISGTYALSGVLLALVAWLFDAGLLDAVTQTVAWSVIFFFASAAASAAYLTAGECFPVEIRALAIALFYAAGTALGGVAAPFLFGRLIETGEPRAIVAGYLVGAALMLGAAGVELAIGVAAERRSLESLAAPLAGRRN